MFPTAEKHRFQALDSWRGICAMCVALMHFPALWHGRDAAFVRGSYLLVDFFFVLSGFVIAYNYGKQISESKGPRPALMFMARRIGRLWPLHIALLTLLLVREVAKALVTAGYPNVGDVSSFTGSSAPEMIVPNAFLMHSWGWTDMPSWNGPSWSIGAEFYTYIVFALVTATIGSARNWAYAALSIFGALTLFFVAPAFMESATDYGFVRCLYGFFVGCLTCALFVRAPFNGHGTTVELVTIAAVVAFLVFYAYSAAAIAAPILFAFTVYVFAAERGVVSRALCHPAPLWAGAVSYSIYMVHWPLILIGGAVLKLASSYFGLGLFVIHDGMQVISAGTLWATDLVAIFYLALLLLIASASYRFIEVPGRDAVRAIRIIQPVTGRQEPV